MAMSSAPLFAGIGGHQSAKSKTDEWLTPPEVLAAVGGPQSFDLDPACPAVRPWPTALQHYTKADNGLLLRWHGRVFLNPPYSNPLLPRFLARMAEHDCGVALIFARTETDAFSRFVWESASGVLFLRGRLNFYLPDGTRAHGNAGAPSVLCAYGPDDLDVIAGCGIAGQLVPLRFPRAYLVLALDQTWREAVLDWLSRQDGPVDLAELYRAFRSHPKAQANPNYQAKIRQVLQQGPFRRHGRGRWSADKEAA
jgi:hypothetical protein